VGTANALLVSTWGVWALLEVALVLGGAGRGGGRDAGSMRWMVLCVVVSFVVGVRLARQPDGALPDPDLATRVGLGLLWFGLALRALSILWLGHLFNAAVVIQRGHRLVTSGPYRFVRHPSYTGAVIAAVGLGIGAGHWTTAAVFALGWLAGLAYRIPVEEQAMRLAFGRAYDDYCARTKRLVPLVY
jgi:protein-S-isoprenylcysteine O-methyltransferase